MLRCFQKAIDALVVYETPENTGAPSYLVEFDTGMRECFHRDMLDLRKTGAHRVAQELFVPQQHAAEVVAGLSDHTTQLQQRFAMDCCEVVQRDDRWRIDESILPSGEEDSYAVVSVKARVASDVVEEVTGHLASLMGSMRAGFGLIPLDAHVTCDPFAIPLLQSTPEGKPCQVHEIVRQCPPGVR